LLARLDVALHAFTLLFGDDRPKVGVFETRPNLDL
jgi:hypothetical protein